MMNTIERARGRWREILPQLGVDTRFLVNKHGPCPLCGGRDRFRFDDKNGEGTYYCNQCGAGVGIIMVRKLKGWTHAHACAEIDKILGDACETSRRREVVDDRARRLGWINSTINGARDPAIVTAYLKRRGLSVSSDVLLGHRAAPTSTTITRSLDATPQ